MRRAHEAYGCRSGHARLAKRFDLPSAKPGKPTREPKEIVAGDVDHDALMSAVRQRYGSWRGRRDTPRIPVEPEPTQGNRRHIDWQAQAAPRMLVARRVPAFQSGRRARQRQASLRTTAALQVVHGLAFSEPSPLYQRLVASERRALQLVPGQEPYFGADRPGGGRARCAT